MRRVERKSYSDFLVKLRLALLALGTSASISNAGTAYQGTFTLPVEARWENTKLPAGDYTITVPSSGARYTVYLQRPKTSAILQAVTAEDGAASGRSQRNLKGIAGVQTVGALEVPGLDLTFSIGRAHESNLCTRCVRRTSPAHAGAAGERNPNLYRHPHDAPLRKEEIPATATTRCRCYRLQLCQGQL
jgi:hypothetical protein